MATYTIRMTANKFTGSFGWTCNCPQRRRERGLSEADAIAWAQGHADAHWDLGHTCTVEMGALNNSPGVASRQPGAAVEGTDGNPPSLVVPSTSTEGAA